MTTRRDFLKGATAASVVGLVTSRGEHAPAPVVSVSAQATTFREPRLYWCATAVRLATPVLTALAAGRLKATMPVEAHVPADRAPFTRLEAVARLLAGLAPWLELEDVSDPAERDAQRHFADLARRGIAALVDERSPDAVDFALPGQTLVDTAFLAEALLRAPSQLWGKLGAPVQAQVLAAFERSRVSKPGESNWVLFASIVEAAMQRFGGRVDESRLAYGLQRYETWYLGDGIYGDGPEFHWDYYNSYVIHPMLLETLAVVGGPGSRWSDLHARARVRLTRFAEIQERLIAPDGSYPIVGRSAAYRCGAFQALALAAWHHTLPATVEPAQARVALTAVIRRTLEAPGTFDAQGWLRIGVCGHQPSLGETYISTGSLYLCAAALLPLGLPRRDRFWSDRDALTTAQKIWSGVDVAADHALREPPAAVPAT